MSESKVIPVVFATDDGYAPYLGVALHSLIAHTNVEKKYQIYILYTKLNKEHRRRLIGMSTAHVAVECVDITEKTEVMRGYVNSNYWTEETIYRLLIPELFLEYKKVVYLDCDLLVLDDIDKLYQTDLTGAVIGVAKCAMYHSMSDHFKTISKIDSRKAFNAGVLLFDCQSFRIKKIAEQSLKLLKEDWELENPKLLFTDQDVLNITCEGKTVKFSMNWNFEWWYHFERRDNYQLLEGMDQYCETASKQIKILHFASKEKPWTHPDYPYADLFWKYARETVFYEEILMNVTVRRKVKFNTFPWRAIEAGSVIVLYGFGDVGKSYLEQMVMTNYCHVCAICDQNASNISDNLIPVVTKEGISEFQFDYIVIAVQDNVAKQQIKQDLLEVGISEEKIK